MSGDTSFTFPEGFSDPRVDTDHLELREGDVITRDIADAIVRASDGNLSIRGGRIVGENHDGSGDVSIQIGGRISDGELHDLHHTVPNSGGNGNDGGKSIHGGSSHGPRSMFHNFSNDSGVDLSTGHGGSINSGSNSGHRGSSGGSGISFTFPSNFFYDAFDTKKIELHEGDVLTQEMADAIAKASHGKLQVKNGRLVGKNYGNGAPGMTIGKPLSSGDIHDLHHMVPGSGGRGNSGGGDGSNAPGPVSTHH